MHQKDFSVLKNFRKDGLELSRLPENMYAFQ